MRATLPTFISEANVIGYLKHFIKERLAQDDCADTHLIVLSRELERFDPRDFEPAFQHQLLNLRVRVPEFAAACGGWPAELLKDILNEVLPVLDAYRGEGSRGVSRTFPYLSDPDLRK